MAWAYASVALGAGVAVAGAYSGYQQAKSTNDASKRSAAQNQQLMEQNSQLAEMDSAERARQFDTGVMMASVQSGMNNEAAASMRDRQDFLTQREQGRFDTKAGRLDPYRKAGTAATDAMSALNGLQGEEAQTAAYGKLTASAGQKWIQKREQDALVGNASKLGGLRGGRVQTQLQEQAAGFASRDIDKHFGRLSLQAGMGLDAGKFQAKGPGVVSMAQVGPGITKSVLPGAATSEYKGRQKSGGSGGPKTTKVQGQQPTPSMDSTPETITARQRKYRKEQGQYVPPKKKTLTRRQKKRQKEFGK